MAPKKASADKTDTGGFGIPLMELRALMELRGVEAADKVKQMGGPKQICKMLITSDTKGTGTVVIINIMVTFIMTYHVRVGKKLFMCYYLK